MKRAWNAFWTNISNNIVRIVVILLTDGTLAGLWHFSNELFEDYISYETGLLILQIFVIGVLVNLMLDAARPEWKRTKYHAAPISLEPGIPYRSPGGVQSVVYRSVVDVATFLWDPDDERFMPDDFNPHDDDMRNARISEVIDDTHPIILPNLRVIGRRRLITALWGMYRVNDTRRTYAVNTLKIKPREWAGIVRFAADIRLCNVADRRGHHYFRDDLLEDPIGAWKLMEWAVINTPTP